MVYKNLGFFFSFFAINQPTLNQ